MQNWPKEMHQITCSAHSEPVILVINGCDWSHFETERLRLRKVKSGTQTSTAPKWHRHYWSLKPGLPGSITTPWPAIRETSEKACTTEAGRQDMVITKWSVMLPHSNLLGATPLSIQGWDLHQISLLIWKALPLLPIITLTFQFSVQALLT